MSGTLYEELSFWLNDPSGQQLEESPQPSSSGNDSQKAEPTAVPIIPFNLPCHIVSARQCRCHWCCPGASPVAPTSNVGEAPRPTAPNYINGESALRNSMSSNSKPPNWISEFPYDASLRPSARPPRTEAPIWEIRRHCSQRMERNKIPKEEIFDQLVVGLRQQIYDVLMVRLNHQDREPTWWDALGEPRDDYWNHEDDIPDDVLNEVNDGSSDANGSASSTAVRSLPDLPEDDRPPSPVRPEYLDPPDHAFDVGPYFSEPGAGSCYRRSNTTAVVGPQGSTSSLRAEPATSERQIISSDDGAQESEGTSSQSSISVTNTRSEPAASGPGIMVSEDGGIDQGALAADTSVSSTRSETNWDEETVVSVGDQERAHSYAPTLDSISSGSFSSGSSYSVEPATSDRQTIISCDGSQDTAEDTAGARPTPLLANRIAWDEPPPLPAITTPPGSGTSVPSLTTSAPTSIWTAIPVRVSVNEHGGLVYPADVPLWRPWDHGHNHPAYSRQAATPSTTMSDPIMEGQIIAERGRTLDIINEGEGDQVRNSQSTVRRLSDRINGVWRRSWDGRVHVRSGSADARRQEAANPAPPPPPPPVARNHFLSPTTLPREDAGPPRRYSLPPSPVVAEEREQRPSRSRRPHLRDIAHDIRREVRDAMAAFVRRGG